MVIPKINSAHGSDTRNIINRAIDLINAQGKSIQDLVAEGQLTPSQYAELVSIVNGNVKKGSITTADIDKNNFAIDQTMITDSLRRIITGNAPINAVPANNSLTTEKYADNSVTKRKKTIGGETATILSWNKLPDIDLVNRKMVFYPDTAIIHSKGRNVVLTETSVDFASGITILILYDTSTGAFRSTNSSNSNILGETEVFVTFLSFTTTSQSELINVVGNLEYTVNGKNRVIKDSVHTDEIEDGAVTPSKTDFIEISTNLLDVDKLERGFSLNTATGEPTPNSNHSISGFIKIKPNTYYTKSSEGRWAWYDENKEYIGTSITETITTPSEARFIRVAIHNNYIDEAQINEGQQLLPYEPYYFRFEGLSLGDGNTERNVETENYFVKKLDSSEVYTAPILPDVSVNSPDNIRGLQHQDIYNLYDELVASYPDYVTSQLLGVEATGKEIYRYDLKPPISDRTSKNQVRIPKVIVISGTHGFEKLAVWVNYQLARLLCESWEEHEGLENLRWNVHLIMIPVQNPYGYSNINQNTGNVDGLRGNSNGVDIARNFPTGWRKGDPESVTYGGEYALSEIEAQLVDQLISDELKDLIYVCDFHNFATTNGTIWNASNSNFHINLAEQLIRTMTSKWKKEHSFMDTFSISDVGYADMGGPPGSVGKHATVEYGVHGGTFEVSELLPFLENEARNSPLTVKFGMDAFINWLNLVVKNSLDFDVK